MERWLAPSPGKTTTGWPSPRGSAALSIVRMRAYSSAARKGSVLNHIQWGAQIGVLMLFRLCGEWDGRTQGAAVVPSLRWRNSLFL